MNTNPFLHFVPEGDSDDRIFSLFGVPGIYFRDVAETMQASRNSVTENDVPGAGGMKSWMDGSRRLREISAPFGWARFNEDQIPAIYCKERRIRIAVMNTDENTGIEHHLPQSRTRKGPMTEKVIGGNVHEQLPIEPLWAESKNIIALPPEQGMTSWYLFVFSHGEILRAELSCPATFSSGMFTGFHERIILIGGGSPGTPLGEGDYDTGPDFDISVIRKAG